MSVGGEMRTSCDIFCTVVDNYGDIGVCWRLARQLAAEQGWRVRLWVDDLVSFARICPDVNAQQAEQVCRQVSIAHWRRDFPSTVTAADVVIEAFACNPPEAYIEAMARRSRPPVWLNLEYLSAEDWVAGCHGLPSPHPRLPLLKHFFFPGFTPDTGGLLREKDLLQRRDDFTEAAAARRTMTAKLGLPQRQPNECRVALFSYPNPALDGLLRAWIAGDQPVTCLLAEGTAGVKWLEQELGQALCAGSRVQLGQLQALVHAFVDQSEYDALLWCCDVLLIRGEDSFVRAQWAAKPFVWHIYPQDDAAHLDKLAAFLGLYLQGLAPTAAATLQQFWRLWNRDSPPEPAELAHCWANLRQVLPELQNHAHHWANSLAHQADLATNLARFCQVRL